MKILFTKEERAEIENITKKINLEELNLLISEKDSITIPSYVIISWINSLNKNLNNSLGYIIEKKITSVIKNELKSILNAK